MGGRPTEALDVPGTTTTGRSWDARSEALVSEPRVPEISAPAWERPGTGAGAMPGRAGVGPLRTVAVMEHSPTRGATGGPDSPQEREPDADPLRDPAPDRESARVPDVTGSPAPDLPATADESPAATGWAITGGGTAGVRADPAQPGVGAAQGAGAVAESGGASEDGVLAEAEAGALEQAEPPAGPAACAPGAAETGTRTDTAAEMRTQMPTGTHPDSDDAPAPSPRAPEIAHTRATPARKVSGSRRGPVDPVKTLMHRHRDLCERAVDPLEIAAGLEAHGVTDRTAARYRHRDVFSLAEELYARVPAVTGEPTRAVPPAPVRDIETRAVWSLLALLPGAACIATAVVLKLTEETLGGGARLTVSLIGALVAFLGLGLCLRSGPLRVPEGRSSAAATLYAGWLLGYVLYGQALLDQVLSGGPEGPWALTPAPLLGLALAVAPAAWCAHLFSVHAHRRLAGSRALEEFAAGVRPLLFGTVALFLCVLSGLLRLAELGYGGGGTLVAAAALGVLLLLARLLTVHGFPEPATTGLAAACAVEAAAPALILAGRLPGLDVVARPVDAVIEAGGTGAVPAIACGAAALGLLIHATVALSRASAHTTV
jgi:hypothetical protein